jgi:mono/diheme cytochrome c family protein
MKTLSVALLIASGALCTLADAVVAADEPQIDFNRDVRSILAENCFQCHGPDSRQRQADLRLDTLDGSRADIDGNRAVVPGKPAESHLMTRILANDEEERMPPAETGKSLTTGQIETLRRWIKSGAEYAEHWAFAPLDPGSLPYVSNVGWPKNPIDTHVLRRLEQKSIQPSPPASRETLIRRVHLDLLGVPPLVDEVEEFVNDNRPAAYERMVDRALARPEFGERWGRHWLDQARYADSHGYTNDNERIMWPYRDWVIEALNRDQPFDQFTIEQLAGDLLDGPSPAQLVATGFHRNTLINTEGGTKPDQFKDEQVKDRVDTTGTVWMGLTVGCAKCHAHKYDPVTQLEYYQLYAFFNSTADRNSETPKIKVPTLDQATRLAQIKDRMVVIAEEIESIKGLQERRAAWETRVRASDDELNASQPIDYAWEFAEPLAKSLADAELEILDDKSILAKGQNKASDEYQVTLRSPLTEVRSVRLELLPDDSLPANGPGRSEDGTLRISEFWFRTGDGRELRFSAAVAQNQKQEHAVTAAIDNTTNTGWETSTSDPSNSTAWFVLPNVLEVEEGHALTFFLQFESPESGKNIGRFRLAISTKEWHDVPPVDELKRLADIPAESRKSHHESRLENAFLRWDSATSKLAAEKQSLVSERESIKSQVAEAMIMQELDERPAAHLQVRGDFLRPGEQVGANVPAILPDLRAGNSATRLDLAQCLVRDDHPLTGRVYTNRLWMRLFERGIVETENDFGVQATLPSHPRLLDWLAKELPYNDWSTKHALRTIICSATYRQSSAVRPDLVEIDQGNVLLARQSRLRVEAEVVRDIGLTASGLMQHVIGGPSVFPPQPEGVYAFTQRAKTWNTSQGVDRYRRGLYTFLYRSAPYPMMTTFDAPRFNTTCTKRDRSNTPLQALTMANSTAGMEAARAFAVRIQREGGDAFEDRLVFAFRSCVGRYPNELEAAVLARYHDRQRRRLSAVSQEGESTENLAWMATARVILNLDETITRE